MTNRPGSRTSFLTLMLVSIAACILVCLIQLSEYFAGYEINSMDMTFYWNLFRRHFFSEGLGLWFDSCGNGLSLVANPLYGLFYFVNGIYSWASYDQGHRMAYLAHYGLFGAGFALWGRELKLSALAIVTTAAALCASGVVLSMASRNVPYLFPMVWLPFVGFFAVKWFETYRWFYGLAIGVAIGTSYMAGDFQAIAYGMLIVFSTWWMQGQSRFDLKKISFLILLTAFGLLMTAGFSLYHSYESLALSDRSAGLSPDEALKFSFHPFRVMEFFWFQFFGMPGTAAFWGQPYTSSLVASQHRWWYGSVYLGFMALPIALGSCSLLFKERRWRGFGLSVLILVFWSTGVWNPVVKAIIDHVSLLRMVRYPAKTMLPAVIMTFPFFAATVDAWFDHVARASRVPQRHKKWVLAGLAVLIVAPPVFQELPFQMLPPALNDVPKVLVAVTPTAAASERVITNMYAKPSEHTALNMHLLERGPMLWNRKSFFCPDAALTDVQRAASLDDFAFADARDNFNVSHIITGPELSANLQSAVKRDELKIIAEDPTDGTKLLAAAVSPTRSKVLTGWQTKSFILGEDTVQALGVPSFRPDAATINERVMLDQSGDLVHGADVVGPLNWRPDAGRSSDCKTSTEGEFHPDRGAGSFVVATECNSYLALNVRFTPGWRVTIDGVKTWVARLNELMIAVPVSKGKHHVLLEFRPSYYRGFVEVSVALQILMFVGAIVAGYRSHLGSSKIK